jgi:hypothetical protein
VFGDWVPADAVPHDHHLPASRRQEQRIHRTNCRPVRQRGNSDSAATNNFITVILVGYPSLASPNGRKRSA